MPPSLGIARALSKRGHSVTFAGRPEMIGRVGAAGFATRELTEAYALIDRFASHPQARIFGYLSSPAVGDELISVVEDERPDLVVIDAMFGAALAAAPRFGTPTAVVVHTFLRRMFGAWKANIEGQSEGRVRAGFTPLPPLDDLWGARNLIQVNTLDAFDGPTADPWVNVRHGAPILEEERRAVPASLPWAADDPASHVLLSFSTVYEQRSPEMLQRALDALAPLPVHVVATTGDIVEPGSLSRPPNAVVLRYASHDALMPRAALAVTHGGHGTAMRSLRHGVPMVCTPALASDQPFVGAAVQEWGAGRALARDASVADIRGAVENILQDASYRASAVRLSAQLADSDGAKAAADALENLTQSRGLKENQASAMRAET